MFMYNVHALYKFVTKVVHIILKYTSIVLVYVHMGKLTLLEGDIAIINYHVKQLKLKFE